MVSAGVAGTVDSVIVVAAEGMAIWSLEARHSSLLRTLCGRGSWSREELENLCAGLGLLRRGALDAMNKAALDAVDEPAYGGDERLVMNAEVVKACLAQSRICS